MQQRPRGPPAPFPVAGQVVGSHIAIASAACSPAGPETDPPVFFQHADTVLTPALAALNSISTQFQHRGNTC